MNTPVLISTFLAASIEVIEMVAIVVAVGATRQWRGALAGTLAGLLVLAVLIAALGTALQRVPLSPIRVVVGALLLTFGLQWVRKGVRSVSRDGWTTGIGEQIALRDIFADQNERGGRAGVVELPDKGCSPSRRALTAAGATTPERPPGPAPRSLAARRRPLLQRSSRHRSRR